MDIYERFHSLPRGRKGTKTVVIVEEGELATLIADAQASEGALMARAAKVAVPSPYHLDRWASTDPGS